MDAFLFSLGGIVIIIGGVVCLLRRFGKINDAQTGGSDCVIPDRYFTLQELRTALPGKYNWDERGTVFEINDDGSITVVGQLIPTEIPCLSSENLRERLVGEGILDMLPRVWAFFERETVQGKEYKLYIESNQTSQLYKLPAVEGSISEAYLMDALNSANRDEEERRIDMPNALQAIIDAKMGNVVLLPGNEREYILSMGAKACLDRLNRDGIVSVRVNVSTPSIMGAFGVVCGSKSNAKVSFVSACSLDYVRCDMEMADGICTVEGLFRSSIIPPLAGPVVANLIAKGILVSELIWVGKMCDRMLMDVLPYSLSLAVVANGQTVQTICLLESGAIFPCTTSYIGVQLSLGQMVSLLIGKTVISHNLIEDCGLVAPTSIWVKAECDTNQEIRLWVKTETENETYIIIGELIG